MIGVALTSTIQKNVKKKTSDEKGEMRSSIKANQNIFPKKWFAHTISEPKETILESNY